MEEIVTLVAVFVAVTLALGMTAPVESAAVPVMLPVMIPWAMAFSPVKTIRTVVARASLRKKEGKFMGRYPFLDFLILN
jgi:hypothetical protein